MNLIEEFSKKKSEFTLFIRRKHLRKIAFTEKCKMIINEKLSFEKALLELPEFLEIVEINAGIKKINIDNKFGVFLAIWDSLGENLIYYEFKTRRDVF